MTNFSERIETNLDDETKKIKKSDVAFLLMLLFCSAPLFAGLIDRQMLKDLSTYDAYVYNKCFMMISNSIYSVVLAFIVAMLAIKIVNEKNESVSYFKGWFLREKWLIFWAVLLAWSIIPTVCSIDVKGAFFGITEMSSGYISYLFSFAVMICMYLVANKERTLLLKYFVVVSDILAAIMLSCEYDIPFLSEFTPPLTGLAVFTNSNHYGYYLAVAIMCMEGQYFTCLLSENSDSTKQRIWRIVYGISAIFNIYALVINDTLGAYLAIVFATVFLMIIWRIRFGKMKVLYWVPVVAIVVLTTLSFCDIITSKAGSTIGASLVGFIADIFKLKHKSAGYELGGSRRIKIWLETIDRIKAHPIVGYGPDMMFDAEGNILMESSPHNEFLECAFFLGIPGLLMYLGGLFCLFADRCRRLKKLSPMALMAAGVIFAYLVSSFFGVRKYHTSPYLYMFLGMLLLNTDEEKQ